MAGGRRVGKRLKAHLDWLTTSEAPEEVGLEALDALEREAAEEGLDPPDRAALVAAWRELGWPGPMEPLHARLLDVAGFEAALGPAFVHSPAGPAVRWPYGTWALAEHRAHVAHFIAVRRSEAALERAYREER